MQKLPLEVMSMIINFLPVCEVFDLMRTSRMFEQACRSVVIGRQRLQLGCEDKWKELDWTPVSVTDTIDWDDALAHDSFLNSLSQMSGIRILRMDMSSESASTRRKKRQLAGMIMMRNAACLQELCLDDGICLNVKDNIRYGQLKRISCAVLHDEDVIACPSLREIAADSMTNTALSLLNPHLVTSLDLEMWSDDLHALSHLSNLTSLHLEIVDEITDEDDVVRDREIGLVCSWFCKLQTLMLYVRWGTIGDESCQHVSQLHHLRKLTMYSFAMDLTTSGFQRLLKGNARHGLRQIKIYTGKRKLDVRRAVIKADVIQMNQETGNKLVVSFETGVRVLGI